jgi:hypothetical protein
MCKLAAAEIEVTVADMRVAVAHAAVFEPYEHFRAPWLGRFPLGPFKRSTPFNDIVTQHGEFIL